MQKLSTDVLESLVDAHGLANILQDLATVCHGKAEHLASNWQDENSAQYWTKAGNAIANLALRPAISDVTYS